MAVVTIDMDRPPSREVQWVIPLAALLSHVPALFAGYVWLDHAHIEEGLALVDGGGWLTLFESGFAGTGFYRPLMALSLSIDSALGGGAGLHHAVTLLWHALAAFLCVPAARSLGVSQRAAFWGALLFAVHPATSLVASAIAFRSESMIAVALLCLVVFHVRGRPWACALSVFCGALTKETALVLAPLFVLALELFAPCVARRPFGTRLWLWGGEALGLGSALLLRLAFAPAWRAAFPHFTASEAVGTRLAALTKSTLLFVWPVRGGICDAFAVTPASAPMALAGLALLGALALIAYRRRGPATLLMLAVLPSLQLVPVMRWWSPHYLYLPLAFATMLAAEAAERWAAGAFRYALPMVTALGGLSLFDASRYRDDEKLWAPEVRAAPGCREGHFYLADAAHGDKRLDEAADHYERALAETPGILSYADHGAALQNLGVVRLEQGRFGEAISLFRAALAHGADAVARRRLMHNLATAELGAGHPAEAADLLRSEVERPDAMPASIFVRARAVAALGQKEEAEALLRRLPQ